MKIPSDKVNQWLQQHQFQYLLKGKMSENYNDSLEIAPYPHFYHQMTVATITQLPFLSSDASSHTPSDISAVISADELTDNSKFRLPLWGICLMVVAYICVFILGIIGNLSVLIVVAKLHRMQNVTNLFISNLAVADLLVLLFCLLPNLISNIFTPWMLGWLLCKTFPYIQGVSVCASVYSLVAISIERCISIQWPFKYQITKRIAKRIIIPGIWILSCSVALPLGIFFDIYKADSEFPDLDFCVERYPDKYKSWSRYYFLIGNLIICFALPLCIIFFCYLTIWFRVYRRPVPNDSNHKNMEMMHQKSKTAVMKMLLVVVLLFALSWLPLYIITLRLKWGSDVLTSWESDVIRYLYPIGQFLGTLNSGINPIVYSFLNKKFRHGFYMIFKCSWNQDHPPAIQTRHKSPTVNILLRRMAVYKVKSSSMCRDDSDDV